MAYRNALHTTTDIFPISIWLIEQLLFSDQKLPNAGCIRTPKFGLFRSRGIFERVVCQRNGNAYQ